MLTHQFLKLAGAGGEWVLWLLLLISFVSFSTMVERWFFFRRREVDVRALGAEVLSKLEAKDVAGARAVLRAHRSVEAAILDRALDWLDDGADAMQQGLQAALAEQRPVLDKGTTLLGTIGNNAPFVGLFGTVLGVVQAFRHLEGGPSGEMGAVMASIAEALVATAVGIGVALPAVAAFNYFSGRAADVEERAEALVNLVLARLRSQRKPGLGE